MNSMNDIEAAVLHILQPHFRASRAGAAVGAITQADIDAERDLIRKHREWLQAYPQNAKPIMAAYDMWLSWFANNCNEAQAAIDSGKRDSWVRERDASLARQERANELAETIPRMI